MVVVVAVEGIIVVAGGKGKVSDDSVLFLPLFVYDKRRIFVERKFSENE